MNYKYKVEVLELVEVHKMPGAWQESDFMKILELLEFDGADKIPDDELREMTAMALSDLEPEEAAKIALAFRFGDKLSAGQRQDLSEELKGERHWEEYAEISFHEELFNVACILNWAFPKEFPEADMVKIRFNITSLNKESAGNLVHPNASFIARLLNDGMDEHNTIYRLFAENIASNSFPEAEDIIWNHTHSEFSKNEHSIELTIYTSWNWVDELKGVKEFESTAFSDGQLQ